MPKLGAITEQERLRRLRGLSVTELAARAEFSHTYVSLVESGRLTPSLRYKKAVAKVLGVRVEMAFPEVSG